jgi:predicted nucleotidyltransferase
MKCGSGGVNRQGNDLKLWNCCARVRTPMIPIPRDFQDFLRLLNEGEVKYLVIGGYAVAYHGYVRYTGDLDIFVELSPENAQKLVTALREFGFDLPKVKPALFLRKGKIIRMGYEPMRLEILNEIDGVSFEECYRQRRVATLGGLRVNFIDIEKLLKNKRASRRAKDLADIEALNKSSVRNKRPRKKPGLGGALC